MKDLFRISFRILITTIFALSIFAPKAVGQKIMMVVMGASSPLATHSPLHSKKSL